MRSRYFLRIGATLVALWFGALMLTGEQVVFSQSNENELVVRYLGPKTIHLAYYQTDDCDADRCVYILRGTAADGTTRVFASRTANRGDRVVFTGTLHLTNLPPRTYSFSIIRETSANISTTLRTTSAIVTGDTAFGSLLFNESWTSGVMCGHVEVPAGRTLTIGAGVKLYDLPDRSCFISVSGSLGLDSTADIRDAYFVFASPHHFTNLNQAAMSFVGGSAGSSISNSSNLEIVVAAPMTISNIQGLNLNVVRPGGTASITRITGLRIGSINLAAGDVVQLTDVQWQGETSIWGEGHVDINDVHVTADLRLSASARVTIRNSVLNNNLRIFGKYGNWEIFDNEFNSDLVLESNVGAVIRDNVFLGAIVFTNVWCPLTDNDHPWPTIRNNSFIGEKALVVESPRNWHCERPIAIGPNYYGDAGGPSVPYTPQNRSFLKSRGASIDNRAYGTPFFALASPLSQGKFRTNRETPPQFWVNGYRIGQSLLSDGWRPIIQGKETLVSIDLVTSDHTVRGVKVYAIFNGMTIYPTRGDSLTLHRDLAQYRDGIDVAFGLSTVNFILPPVTQNTASLQVFLDISGISGYPVTQTSFELINRTLHFEPPPARRPLKIMVVPVRLPEGAASAEETAAVIKTLLPAMMPILPDQVQVRIGPAVQQQSYWTRLGLINSLATILTLRKAFINQYAYQYNRPAEETDFIVAVMPRGTLGEGVHGASLPLRRGVIFVDQDHPEAFIHEMGHAIGLYTWVEQYDMPEYAPVGKQLQDVTIFLGLPATGSPKINQQFAHCDSGRICHVPASSAWWKAKAFYDWYDVMGAVEGSLHEWPAASTLDAFKQFFALPLTTSVSYEPAVAHNIDLAQTGWRTVVVLAQLEQFETVDYIFYAEPDKAPCYAWRVLPETIRLTALASPADVAAIGQMMAPSIDHNASVAALPRCNRLIHPPLFVDAYDARGRIVSGGSIGRFVQPPDPARRYEAILDMIRLPPEVVRVEVRDYVMGRQLATFAVTTPAPLRITSLSDGAHLAPAGYVTSTVLLNWELAGASATIASSQPMQYLVEYSIDQGMTWQPLNEPFEQTSLAIPISALPVSDNLTLRVTASNGITASSAQVSGLRRPNARPLVVIHSPADGAQAVAGTRWTLQASAYDLEDGLPLQGTWRTLTGTIGVGPVLAGVVLPVGQHTLTYEVVDRQGLRASASVTVSVVATPAVDLAVTPEALRVYAPRWSGSTPASWYLTQGITNTFALQLPTVSREVTATVTLYLTPPNGSETVLLSRQVQLQPLQPAEITVQYVPPAAGTYTFRAVLSDVEPADANPSNNQASWQLNALQPPAITVTPHSPLVIRTAVGFFQSVPVSLTNTGAAPLFIADLRVAGADASRFFISQDTCRFTQLAPGATCVVQVGFRPTAIGEATAVLQIASTDPVQPLIERPIAGIAGAPQRVYVPLIQRAISDR